MVGATKNTSFNNDWLQCPQFSSWLKEVPNRPRSARCHWCATTFSLSNMGKRALLSHAESKKHLNIMKTRNKSLDISVSLLGSKCVGPDNTITAASSSQGLPEELVTKSAVEVAQTTATSSKNETPSRGINAYMIAENVTRAEILWCLHTVEAHHSLRAAAKSVALFPIMFPDSQIAGKLKLQRTKLGYLLTHGLAPYFHNELISELKDCTDIVVGFDESLNKVSQLGQMDIFVRFWKKQTNQVTTRYFTSAFLNHATAADLLRAFTSALFDIVLKKLLQISMDGPNVNFKFHRDLNSSLVTDPEDRVLLDIGSCGLHNVNGAFKAGVKAASWEVSEFLGALYTIFKHTPARRGDYTHYSGSKLFPRKFCSVRWLENGPVAERAVEIIPNVKKYIHGITADKKALPESKSFKIVQSALKDHLLFCKLSFFQCVAAEVEPFLTEFQTDKPMAPLLFESLSKVLVSIMKRFIKPEVLDTAKFVYAIDIFDKKNLLDYKLINIGHGTRESIRKVRALVSDRDILEFRQQCRLCLQKMCEKLQTRSPLTYALTKGISCLDPLVAVMPITRDSRLDVTLNEFVKKKQISGIDADRIESQFKLICGKDTFVNVMKGFSRKNDRLDDLWMCLVKETGEASRELMLFLQKVLILSHGNADLERGFSVNRECIMENQKGESLVAQRQVYDAISTAGGIEALTITKSMIHAARNARARYEESMVSKEKQQMMDEKINSEKKALALQLKELEEQKRNFIESTKHEEALLDERIKNL